MLVLVKVLSTVFQVRLVAIQSHPSFHWNPCNQAESIDHTIKFNSTARTILPLCRWVQTAQTVPAMEWVGPGAIANIRTRETKNYRKFRRSLQIVGGRVKRWIIIITTTTRSNDGSVNSCHIHTHGTVINFQPHSRYGCVRSFWRSARGTTCGACQSFGPSIMHIPSLEPRRSPSPQNTDHYGHSTPIDFKEALP